MASSSATTLPAAQEQETTLPSSSNATSPRRPSEVSFADRSSISSTSTDTSSGDGQTIGGPSSRNSSIGDMIYTGPAVQIEHDDDERHVRPSSHRSRSHPPAAALSSVQPHAAVVTPAPAQPAIAVETPSPTPTPPLYSATSSDGSNNTNYSNNSLLDQYQPPQQPQPQPVSSASSLSSLQPPSPSPRPTSVTTTSPLTSPRTSPRSQPVSRSSSGMAFLSLGRSSHRRTSSSNQNNANVMVVHTNDEGGAITPGAHQSMLVREIVGLPPSTTSPCPTEGSTSSGSGVAHNMLNMLHHEGSIGGNFLSHSPFSLFGHSNHNSTNVQTNGGSSLAAAVSGGGVGGATGGVPSDHHYPTTASTSKTLRIELDQNQVVLMQGEAAVLKGTLYVTLNKNTKVKALHLEFSGRTSVTWVDDNAYSPATRHTSAPHIERTWDFISPPTSKHQQTEQLQSGQHAFPFSVTLPDTLPESLTTSHGKVAYRLTATLTKPGLGFTSSSISMPVDLLRKHAIHDLRTYQRGGRAVSNPGERIQFKIRLPQIRLPHSQKIPLHVTLTSPGPHIHITALQVGVWEKVIYRADGRKRHDTRLVKVQKSEGWPHQDSQGRDTDSSVTWTKTLLFDMPKLGIELTDCNPSVDNGLMRVTHFFRFSILAMENGKRFRVESETDIKILAFEDSLPHQHHEGGEANGSGSEGTGEGTVGVDGEGLPSYLTSFSTPRVSLDTERQMGVVPMDDDLMRALVGIHLPSYTESEDDMSRNPSRDVSRDVSRNVSRNVSRATSPERSFSHGSGSLTLGEGQHSKMDDHYHPLQQQQHHHHHHPYSHNSNPHSPSPLHTALERHLSYEGTATTTTITTTTDTTEAVLDGTMSASPITTIAPELPDPIESPHCSPTFLHPDMAAAAGGSHGSGGGHGQYSVHHPTPLRVYETNEALGVNEHNNNNNSNSDINDDGDGDGDDEEDDDGPDLVRHHVVRAPVSSC